MFSSVELEESGETTDIDIESEMNPKFESEMNPFHKISWNEDISDRLQSLKKVQKNLLFKNKSFVEKILRMAASQQRTFNVKWIINKYFQLKIQ